MAPEDLILSSVPCCANAVPASASAAMRTKRRFISAPWGWLYWLWRKFYLVQAGSGIAHPLGDGGEKRGAEGRVGLDQVEEYVAADAEQHAVGLRGGVGGARRLVDQRHLAEHPADADILHQGAADGDRDAAFQHHVHQRAGLAGDHDHRALVVALV